MCVVISGVTAVEADALSWVEKRTVCRLLSILPSLYGTLFSPTGSKRAAGLYIVAIVELAYLGGAATIFSSFNHPKCSKREGSLGAERYERGCS